MGTQSPTCQPLPTADAVSELRITISGITDSPNNHPPDLRTLGSGRGHNSNELKVGEDACITQYCLHRPGMLIAQPFRARVLYCEHRLKMAISAHDIIVNGQIQAIKGAEKLFKISPRLYPV